MIKQLATANQIMSWVRQKLPCNCPWGEEIENFYFWRENLKFFKKTFTLQTTGLRLMLALHAFFAFITRVDFCREHWFFKKNTKIFVAFFQKNQIFDKNQNSKSYLFKLLKHSTFVHSPSIYPIFSSKVELLIHFQGKTWFFKFFTPKSVWHTPKDHFFFPTAPIFVKFCTNRGLHAKN